jgi:hypothetical protein
MSLPNVNIALQDFALGLVEPAAHTQAIVGTAASGTANVVVAISDLKTLKDTFGSGPLVEAAAHYLVVAGGPVYCCKVAAANNGSNGNVTKVGTGPAPGAAPSGNPLDDYSVVVKIVVAGARGTATFKISFDGGDNFSEEYVTAASLSTWAAETGLTITFTNTSNYSAGTTYSWESTGPTYDSGDLATGLDSLHASGYSFEAVQIVGTVGGADDATKVTNFMALAAAVDTKMTAWATGFRYAFAILQVPNVADSALNVSAVTSFASTRIMSVPGDVELVSAVTARRIRRNATLPIAARLGAVDLQRSPACPADGTLPGVAALYRDERITEALDTLRFTTLRTFDSAFAGFYVSNGRLMAPAGSDYSFVQNRRVMDRVATVARQGMIPYVNKDLRVDVKTGRILEKEALAIEADLRSKLEADLVAPGRAEAIQVQVNRTDNILSTQTLNVRVRCIPKSYSRFINLDLGFENPALAAAS